MGEILGAVPGLAGAGAGGLLLLLVMYLVKANRDDRGQHRETVTALRAEHATQVKDLQDRIDRLDKKVDELQRLVDDERELRRAAEDRAGRAEAQLSAWQQVTGGAADGPATTRLPPAPPVGMAPGPDPVDDRGHPGGGQGGRRRRPSP